MDVAVALGRKEIGARLHAGYGKTAIAAGDGSPGVFAEFWCILMCTPGRGWRVTASIAMPSMLACWAARQRAIRMMRIGFLITEFGIHKQADHHSTWGTLVTCGRLVEGLAKFAGSGRYAMLRKMRFLYFLALARAFFVRMVRGLANSEFCKSLW